jgi:hypothetical protein
MKITDPVLAPDVSVWCDHINAKEFEDGGCESVVVGLYPQTVGGKWVLNPTCRNQCIEVARTSMVLQAYYWDDITLSPTMQAAWVAETIQREGLPVKFVWADLEQWWTNWAAWANARQCKIPWSEVPTAAGANISSHMQTFCAALRGGFPNTGVYTNNGFVSSWAIGMNAWLPAYLQWPAQYKREPQQVTAMSWAQLKASWLPDYDIALAAGQLPEQVEGHQFTGDMIELPGSYDQYGRELPLDVSVFSKVFIDSLRGGTPVAAPAPVATPSVPTLYPIYKVMPGVNPNVHQQASATSITMGVILAGTVVAIDTFANGYAHMQPIEGFPAGGWLYSSYLKKQGS